MPFTLFPARCLYVVSKPLSYRKAVIGRLYKARVFAHLSLLGALKAQPLLYSTFLI